LLASAAVKVRDLTDKHVTPSVGICGHDSEKRLQGLGVR
jgi:hypothetical protein